MRYAVLILIICSLGCRTNDDVKCSCYGNGVGKDFDMGNHHNPNLSTFQATCDTIGAQNGYDSCWVHSLKD